LNRTSLALGLMAASGFAALGYQIVWTQQSTIWLGHEAAAVLAVVAAFFGGLALGALALGARIDASRHPGRWYAACEAAIGLWSLALAFLMAPAGKWLLGLTGAQPSPAWQWAVAFLGTFVLLLPATAAMGATLPAMERVMARLRREGSPIAALYAGNTFGAVAGVLAAAFWLVPEFGLARTAAVCAALNLTCAAAALKLFADSGEPAPARPRAGGVLFLLAATGLLGIGYEVLVVRVLSEVAENTVYTFAMLLAVYLVGTAAGAAAYTRRPGVGDRLLPMLAAACLLGASSLFGAEKLKATVLEALGPSMAAALAGEAAIAVAAFLLPTFMMGAVFSHLSTSARAAGIGFGRALGVNTLGAAIAPLLFGVLLLPALGPKFALLSVAAGYLALMSWRALFPWGAAAVILGLAVFAPPLAFVDVPEGGRIVSYKEGAMAAVSVVEDSGGVARLRIDNRQQEGSSATRLADSRQALLPLLLHPAPRRALFLGLGTGVTASAAAEDPMLQVDAVELLPEVIDASAFFRRKFEGSAARLHLMAADARRFVRATSQRYDLIVSDNFHPARSGSGSLYTVEHFKAVRDRLAAGGLFCQWLPLHQLDSATLRSIVRSFVTVYPDGWALLATNSLETPVLGLVALKDGNRFDVGQVRRRLADSATSPAKFGIDDDLALLGSFVAGPRALARFAGDAPLNTDDHPVVAYRAPRITYVPDSLPRDRLIALLREMGITPEELVSTSAPAAWRSRLAAYWAARDRFIEAGRDVRPTPDVRRMLSQVREPLLSVLRISPDFRPAYDPLLRMATALARVDAAAARTLLAELREAQPSRPEAAQALRELSGASPEKSPRAGSTSPSPKNGRSRAQPGSLRRVPPEGQRSRISCPGESPSPSRRQT
jgi:spermidine synthase